MSQLNKLDWDQIRKESWDWKWKRLQENFDDAEEPQGIAETIDSFFWGKQNANQKAISKDLHQRALRRINWKKKEKNN